MTYDAHKTSELAELVAGELTAAWYSHTLTVGSQGAVLALDNGRSRFDVVAGRDQHGNPYAQVQWSADTPCAPLSDWALLFTAPAHFLENGVRLRKPYTAEGLAVLLADVRALLVALTDSPRAA